MKDQINPPGTPEPSLTVRTGVEDLIRLSSSFDGFKRENAVRRLGMIGDPTAIPALIVRANDWVPEVRAAAYDALLKMLMPANAAAVLASLPQFLHLQRCTRGHHDELLQAVQDFLTRDGMVDTLRAAWNSDNVHVARLVTQVLISKRALPPAEILTEGLSSKDVAIRAIVIDLLRELADSEFETAVSTALSDPYMPVRREAFQQLMRRSPAKGLAVAKELLFDTAVSIRELAVRHLLAAEAPVEELYANALSTRGDRAPIVRCALWAWGTMNCRSRVGQVKQMLTSQLPSVRRTALQAFAKLSPDAAVPHLEAALADSSVGVSKEAARLLLRIGVSVDVETLITIARARNEPHVTASCHELARHGSKWDWLKFVLSVFPASGSGVSREALRIEIHVWNRCFNRDGAQPDRRTLRELGDLVSACESQLAPKQVELLKFTLGVYRS